MLKPNRFKIPHSYFHFNFEFTTHSYFKTLDWDFLCLHLENEAKIWNAQIQALVMMDTHAHILFRIADAKENFFADALLKKIKPLDQTDSLVEPITNLAQYLNTYKYIYRNPLEAGLCHNCESYPYSSLMCLLGRGLMKAQVTDQMGLIQHPQKILTWLNAEETQAFRASQFTRTLSQES